MEGRGKCWSLSAHAISPSSQDHEWSRLLAPKGESDTRSSCPSRLHLIPHSSLHYQDNLPLLAQHHPKSLLDRPKKVMDPSWITNYCCGSRHVPVPFCGLAAPPDATTSLTDHEVQQLFCWASNLIQMELWCIWFSSHRPRGSSISSTHSTVGRFLSHGICVVPPSLTPEDVLDIPTLSFIRLTCWPEGEHSSFRRGTLLGEDLTSNTCYA